MTSQMESARAMARPGAGMNLEGKQSTHLLNQPQKASKTVSARGAARFKIAGDDTLRTVVGQEARTLATYHADIHEAPNREGNFVAVLREAAINTTGPDPEHDLCHAMMEAGLPGGEIQFWRGTTRSLLYRSVHWAAAYRIKLGDSFPYRLVKRREVGAEILSLRCPHDSGTAKPGLAGTSGLPIVAPVPENVSAARESRL